MKKILSFVFSLFLSLGLLTACGGAQKTPAPSQKQISSSAVQSNNKTESKSSGKIEIQVDENKTYTDKNHVAAYIHTYKKLPSNYITKAEAQKLGWKDKGTLDKVAPGKSIGGDLFGNYEKLLPEKQGRSWKECDIDYVRGSRNAKRICYSNDGLIYYSASHYKDFEKMY